MFVPKWKLLEFASKFTCLIRSLIEILEMESGFTELLAKRSYELALNITDGTAKSFTRVAGNRVSR